MKSGGSSSKAKGSKTKIKKTAKAQIFYQKYETSQGCLETQKNYNTQQMQTKTKMQI